MPQFATSEVVHTVLKVSFEPTPNANFQRFLVTIFDKDEEFRQLELERAIEGFRLKRNFQRFELPPSQNGIYIFSLSSEQITVPRKVMWVKYSDKANRSCTVKNNEQETKEMNVRGDNPNNASLSLRTQLFDQDRVEIAKVHFHLASLRRR